MIAYNQTIVRRTDAGRPTHAHDVSYLHRVSALRSLTAILKK
jgi:hypothetical protein